MNQETLLSKIVNSLSKVRGVKAITLGGSQSRNEADEDSDFDIGLYYDEAHALDVTTLGQVLRALDQDHKDELLNPPGRWGPWINGGAWLTVDNIPVDILLRDIRKVEKVIHDCVAGIITIDYQCGHPFGFVNSIYAAEIHYCKILWQDESAPLDRLKNLLYSDGEYSPCMREAIIKKFLWEAWFSLSCGRKAAFKRDVNYALGSVFRAVCSWLEVLYALNNCYLMNEKGALSRINHFAQKPVDLETKVKSVYQLLAVEDAGKAYQILDEIHHAIQTLSGEISPIITRIR